MTHCAQWNNPTWAAQVLDGRTLMTLYIALRCVPDVLMALGFSCSSIDRIVGPWIQKQRAARNMQTPANRDAQWYPSLSRRFRFAPTS